MFLLVLGILQRLEIKVWMLHHDDHVSEVASVDEAGFNISLPLELIQRRVTGAGTRVKSL